MKRYFLQGAGVVAAALLAMSAATAAERGAHMLGTAHSDLLAGALQHLRHEQRAVLPRQARLQLAELRSEITSALAQGGANSTRPNIQAAP